MDMILIHSRIEGTRIGGGEANLRTDNCRGRGGGYDRNSPLQLFNLLIYMPTDN